MRGTEIVCTIGPATASREMIHSLIKNGIDVARLNFSYGSHEFHRKSTSEILTAIERLNELKIPER